MSKYKEGEIVKGCVTGIENYGIFINLDEFYTGLIHISEISSSFVRNVNDYVKIGETIKVKVLEEDEKHHHVKLSIKDIDYRINRRRNNKIVETTQGFSTLGTMLDKWIKEKTEEIKEQAKKN